jgi:capping protein beta
MECISGLNIAARLPPGEVDNVKEALSNIAPALKKFIHSRLDGRLQTLTDETTGKLFIASDFNRNGKSYRSPWSNEYIPSSERSESSYYPPPGLRRIEATLNELMLSYCNLYYDNGVGSCYLSESPTETAKFFGAFQVKKDFHDSHSKESHTWESQHSFEVNSRTKDDSIEIHISMASTILVIFEFEGKTLPSKINGSTSKSNERTYTILKKDDGTALYDEVLVRNLGELMEENESSLRGNIDMVCIPRCSELAMASFGTMHDETLSDSSSEIMEDDYRPRVSLGTMNPLHRQSVKPESAFQADLMGAILQRKLRESLGGS